MPTKVQGSQRYFPDGSEIAPRLGSQAVGRQGGSTMAEETRVLVVDDEENIRDLVSMGLRYEGYDVETHESGRAALAAVPRFRPDLIVLDVMMPGLDGFEVCRRLQAD